MDGDQIVKNKDLTPDFCTQMSQGIKARALSISLSMD